MNPTYTFTYPKNIPTYYVFYQGQSCASDQALRYLDEREFILPTGEIYTRPDAAIGLMERDYLWVYPKLREVNTTAEVPADYRQVDAILSKPYTPAYPTDMPGSMIKYSIDKNYSSAGQDTDIRDHYTRTLALQYMLRRNEQARPYNTVLMGVSRGAAATFSALAENKERYENVKLCVLEAPPASMPHVFKFLTGSILAKPVYFFARKLGFLGWQHKSAYSKQAIGHADEFPDDVPVVFITSQKDKLVPISGVLELACTVAINRRNRNNTTPVYLIQLENSDHDDYSTNPEDAARYQELLHAIYRRHNLAYVERLANAGESQLRGCNLLEHPSLDDQAQFFIDKKHSKEIRRAALNHLIDHLKINDDTIQVVNQLKAARNMPLFSLHRDRIKTAIPQAVLPIATASQQKIDSEIKLRM